MLEVVQGQQRVATLQTADDALDERRVRSLADTKLVGNRRDDQVWTTE